MGLSRKKITVRTKRGKTFQRSVMVRAEAIGKRTGGKKLNSNNPWELHPPAPQAAHKPSTGLSPLEKIWRAQAKHDAAWAAHKNAIGSASTEERDKARDAWYRANKALVKLRGW